MAILTSFHMGFHTLTIQKKGDEVWRVLSSAKTSSKNSAALWTKSRAGWQVQNTIAEVGVRTRAIDPLEKCL